MEISSNEKYEYKVLTIATSLAVTIKQCENLSQEFEAQFKFPFTELLSRGRLRDA